MITYKPLWVTLKAKNITTNQLKEKHNVNNHTLYKLRHDKPLNTVTIDNLCNILGCEVEDIMKHVKSSEFDELVKNN